MLYHHVQLIDYQAPIVETGSRETQILVLEKNGETTSTVEGVVRVVVPLFPYVNERHLGEKIALLKYEFLEMTGDLPEHLVFIESAGKCGLAALTSVTALPGKWTTYEAGFDFESLPDAGEA